MSEDTILSNWPGKLEIWKATSGACTHSMHFCLSTTTFPRWGLTCMQHPVVSWAVPAPQTLLKRAEEGNKDLTSSKYVSVPTQRHSSLTGMLQNQKDMDKLLILLSYFCSWTKTLIRYTSQMNSKKHRQSLYSTNILKKFAIISRGLGLDSLGFVRQQLWITYSHWWWWWAAVYNWSSW